MERASSTLIGAEVFAARSNESEGMGEESGRAESERSRCPLTQQHSLLSSPSLYSPHPPVVPSQVSVARVLRSPAGVLGKIKTETAVSRLCLHREAIQ